MPRLEMFDGSDFEAIDLAADDCFGSEFLDWLKPESLDPTETTEDRQALIDALPKDEPLAPVEPDLDWLDEMLKPIDAE